MSPVFIMYKLQYWLIFFELNIKIFPWSVTLSWHLSHTSIIPKILPFFRSQYSLQHPYYTTVPFYVLSVL